MTPRRKPLANINITPLVDVLLILMTILMVAMPLYAKRMPVSLPQTTLDAPPSIAQSVRIGLTRDGTLTLDEQASDLEAVLSKITEASSVEVYPDEAVPYGALAKLSEQIQARHPRDFALMTR